MALNETWPQNNLDPTDSAAQHAALKPGFVVNNRYLIERELGRGGFGAVYLARDKQLSNRPVVVKVLLKNSLHNNWIIKRFRDEIHALSTIDHPNIVGIFDTGDFDEGRPYIVMQYVEGGNLRAAMGSPMAFQRAANLFRQIGRALNVANQKGIFHRDLKPENIMIQKLSDGEEQAKIIDFGIAKIKDSLTGTRSTTGPLAGTILYMAPEQLEQKTVTSETDIYAFGIVAYEVLCGQRPFNPESIFQLLEMQRAGVTVKPRQLRADIPESAQSAILRALSFHPADRYRQAQQFGDELWQALQAPKSSHDNVDPLPGAATLPMDFTDSSRAANRFKVAILYKRNAQPDEMILKLLEEKLRSQGFDVFVDRHMSIGVEWAREIEHQVRSADAVIPLLSDSSVFSEMLTYEVQTAHDAAQKQLGKPRLLPVRIQFEKALPDPLAVILNPLQYASWNNEHDNVRLVKDLLDSLQSPTIRSVARVKLEPIGGAVPLDSKFYIVRPSDEDFVEAIERRDSIVLVKGARQMGKTSLLARGLQVARQIGARVVLTDFQSLSADQFDSVDIFYQTLAEALFDQLDLDKSPQEAWTSERGPSINFQRYIRREVLGKFQSPIVWGLDEVDRLFTCPFGSEVFGLFRSWHNARSLDPDGPWKQLTMAIAYATEAHLFISDLNQSPFNVGTRLVLDDFSVEQVSELNRRYESPLKDQTEVAGFYQLLGGHPYLVRRGLHEMTTRGTSWPAFMRKADQDEGPFGDHLRRFLVLLAQDNAMCDVMRGILSGSSCPSTESFYRLRSAGLLAGESFEEARPRCQLYATYLGRHLL